MEINSGDTAWILVSTGLVLVMTPALAFFYGGMARKKNVLSTLNLSFIMMAVLSIQWLLFGYSLAFGSDVGGLIGGLDFLGFSGVGADPSVFAPTIPHMLFAAFQMMFAIITPALITGAFVVLSVSSFYLLKRRHEEFARNSLKIALIWPGAGEKWSPTDTQPDLPSGL